MEGVTETWYTERNKTTSIVPDRLTMCTLTSVESENSGSIGRYTTVGVLTKVRFPRMIRLGHTHLRLTSGSLSSHLFYRR